MSRKWYQNEADKEIKGVTGIRRSISKGAISYFFARMMTVAEQE